MTENTATRPNDSAAKKAAARALSVVSRLKSGALNAITRHQRREAALRVHRATRHDGGNGDAEAVRGPESSPESAAGGARPGPFARLLNRLRGLFEAHAARLRALRVYDRTRG